MVLDRLPAEFEPWIRGSIPYLPETVLVLGLTSRACERPLASRALQRQREAERGATNGIIPRPDATAVGLDDAFGNRQAKPSAS
jgi:hypothetical protein